MNSRQTKNHAQSELPWTGIFSIVPATLAAIWIGAFLYFFFTQSIEDPALPRTAIWSMMADEMLGLEDASASRTVPVQPSGIEFLTQRLPIFLLAALILVLAVIHGDAICRVFLNRICLHWTEHVVLRLGIGTGLQSLVVLFCGLTGQLSRTTLAIPACISLVVSCVAIWRSRQQVPKRTSSTPAEHRASRVISILVTLVVVPFGIYLLLGSVSPPTDFDVREYHLQGPKEWFQDGQISFLPHNVYTSFPFLSEMLSLNGMVFANDWWHGALVGQVVLAFFQLLSALAVFSIARRWISTDVAWLAVLFYLTTPWTLRISLIAYAEGALAFYLIAATMCALLIGQFPERANRLAVAAGLMAGNAMASKYTGLISVIVPTAVLVAYQIWKLQKTNDESSKAASENPNGWRSLWLPAAGFGLGVAAMIAPWLLKNLVETGNPVYPLGYTVFGGSEWSPEMDARWKPAHAASEHELRRIPEHILGAAVYNKWTSALLFALAVPGVLLWRRNQLVPVLFCLIVWGFATWWAFTHRIDRFWIPMIPLLSLAAAMSWLISKSTAWKSFLATTIAAVTLFNIRFCCLALVGFHVGLMDLDAARQMTIRSDIRYLNATLPAESRVLMVGEAEVFDATFTLLYHTVFDDCLFEDWTSDPDDQNLPASERRMLAPEIIRQELQDRGVTHVLVNWGAVLRYRLTYGYTEYVVPARFTQLVDAGVLKSPRVLLQQPWDKMSKSEQEMVESWDGHQALITGGNEFSDVELYPVAE